MKTQEAQLTTHSYTEDIVKLLHKAGILGAGIKRILAKQSTSRKDYYDEQKRTWQTSKGELELDRTDVQDYTVPKKGADGRIVGDWRNNLTKAEQQILIDEVGLPIFVIGEMKTLPSGESVDIPDTKIPLYHLKEFDLSDPVQHVYWNIVKNSSLVKQTKDECMGDDWASFYVHDVELEQRKEEQSIDFRLEAAELARKASDADMEQVAWLLHYKGIEPMQGDITRKSLAVAFKRACLNERIADKVVQLYNLKDRVGYLALHRLISMGHIEVFGNGGPYHAQRSHASQDRGELIGDTEYDAVIALRSPRFSHLVRLLDGKTTEEKEVEKNSNVSAAIDNVRNSYMKSMSPEKIAISNGKNLRAWLTAISCKEPFDESTSLEKLRDIANAELSKV